MYTMVTAVSILGIISLVCLIAAAIFIGKLTYRDIQIRIKQGINEELRIVLNMRNSGTITQEVAEAQWNEIMKRWPKDKTRKDDANVL